MGGRGFFAGGELEVAPVKSDRNFLKGLDEGRVLDGEDPQARAGQPDEGVGDALENNVASVREPRQAALGGVANEPEVEVLACLNLLNSLAKQRLRLVPAVDRGAYPHALLFVLEIEFKFRRVVRIL